MKPDQPQPERFLRVREVIARTSFSRATLYSKIKSGDFVKPVRISDNRIGFPESAVAAWINAKIAAAV